MKTNQIEIGDIVRVDFHNAQFTLCYEGKVHYMPQATGDSWIIENIGTNIEEKGKLYYISEGCTITKTNS